MHQKQDGTFVPSLTRSQLRITCRQTVDKLSTNCQQIGDNTKVTHSFVHKEKNNNNNKVLYRPYAHIVLAVENPNHFL